MRLPASAASGESQATWRKGRRRRSDSAARRTSRGTGCDLATAEDEEAQQVRQRVALGSVEVAVGRLPVRSRTCRSTAAIALATAELPIVMDPVAGALLVDHLQLRRDSERSATVTSRNNRGHRQGSGRPCAPRTPFDVLQQVTGMGSLAMMLAMAATLGFVAAMIGGWQGWARTASNQQRSDCGVCRPVFRG
jgi:hypothetical protein